MSTPTYPPLDEATLKIIRLKLQDDPEYLTRPECPYHKDTVGMFISTSTGKTEEVNGLERQKEVLKKLREQMEKQSQRFDSDSLEPSEANAYFRQRMNIEKEILALEEQIHHIDNVDAFFATVLQIMEDVLETDQRDEVMTRLNAIKNKEA